jgi:Uma2 family endonuclease
MTWSSSVMVHACILKVRLPGYLSMAIDAQDVDLWLVRQADGLKLDLLPLQGYWTEEQYLRLTDQTNHLIEFTNGVIEVLPVPTREHQRISAYLYRMLFAATQVLGGIILYAPLRVQIRPGTFREPDLVLLLDEHDPRNQDAFWLGADLVVEIVSPDRPQRDLEEKPIDYAEAGISEYWIVNPLDHTIRVLTLADDGYRLHGNFVRGEQATSALLADLVVNVDAVFAAS